MWVSYMLTSVIVSMGCVLVLMAWIGWRFFLMQPVSANEPTSAVPAETLQVKPQVAAATMTAESGEMGGKRSNARWLASAPFRMLTHWSLWLALLLVVTTAAGVLALSGRFSLDPLSAAELGRQEHIQAALNPEKLVPPPALPPSVFAAVDRPGLMTADRDWSRLNPDFVQDVLRVFAKMEARGYPLVLLEGYRSPERQNALADSHVQVTNARAFQSKHQYGLAVDVAPMKDGRIVISERDPWAMQAYQALGEEAERVGLTWGGRWRLKDFGHIEVSGPLAAILKSKGIARADSAAL